VRLAALALVLLACSSKAEAPRPPRADAAPASPPAAPPASTPPPRPKLHIQLRSTPSGAEAAVDGRPAGKTPTLVELDDDGREHELTFVLPGYGLERYRTRPVQSGVIHARMHAVAKDAGR
jgi:PEGA domain